MHYPIDLHTHTVASTHAYSTLHDYVAIAKLRGIALFATTDHGPAIDDAPHPFHFHNLRVVPRVIDGVGILRGIEANIINSDGDIDCTERMLANLDFIVAGFHHTPNSRVDQQLTQGDKLINTKALIAAMAKGHIHMISHPGNPHYPIDITAVAEAAQQYNVALELNNSSFLGSRQGSEENCYYIAKAVKEAGGYLALGSDSHIAYSLGDFAECQRILDAVDFPVERILNRSCAAVLDFITQRTRRVIKELAYLY